MLLKLIKKFKLFFIPYLLFLLGGGVFMLFFNREESHLFFNHFFDLKFHHFFLFMTYVGHGYTFVFTTVILLFIQYRYALFLAASGIIAGGTTQLLKNFVFDDYMRPFYHFSYMTEANIQLVPDVEMHIHSSFPSGHTTTAFCLFTALMLIVNKKGLAWIFFLLAIVIGYSRVYLSQHFFIDIYFGSLVGTSLTLCCYLVFIKYLTTDRFTWLGNSILRK